jgi:lysozyme
VKTSENGLEFIARWEGEVLHVYSDMAGIPTIGIGHALRPGESYPNGITHAQAMALLAADVGVAEAAVNYETDVALSQSQFDACVSFAFNCGGGAYRTSTVLRCINGQDWDGAAKAFLLWDKRKDPKSGMLVVDQSLLARRKAEAALFQSDGPAIPGPV